MPYATTWDALERCAVRSGVKMLVIGAGALGATALALGKWLGAETFAAVRRRRNSHRRCAPAGFQWHFYGKTANSLPM